MKKVLFCLMMIVFNTAYSSTGPTSTPLTIQYMYTTGSSIYIRFTDGSMPGCHGNNSGRLHEANSRFDEIYNQILTMSVIGCIKGQVIYTVKNPGEGQWSDCQIDGLALQP